MERKRRWLLQAVFICAVLIDSAKCSCNDADECNVDANLDNACIDNKCACKGDTFGTNCEHKCDIKCSSNHLKCVIDIVPTKCECESTDFVQVDPLDLLGDGCKAKDCLEDDDCNNNGKCQKPSGTCSCDDNHFGDKCEKECARDCSLKNNLACHKRGNLNKCECLRNDEFEQNDDADILLGCHSKSCEKDHYCMHGHECKSGQKCDCSDKYFGAKCEKICASDCLPSLNLMCKDHPDVPLLRICNCTIGNFKAKDVTAIEKGCYLTDDCTEFPTGCLNGGNCDVDTKKCECVGEYYGHNCGVSCESKCPAIKNLKCVTTDRLDETKLKCDCKDDQHKPDTIPLDKGGSCYQDPCKPDPCQNTGVCRETSTTTYVCDCQSPFFGRNCENNCIEVCKDSMNLTCIKDDTDSRGFKCECKEKPKFVPSGTDIETQGCRENKCYQFTDCGLNGKCLEQHPNEPICNCSKNYFGSKCETECDSVCSNLKNLTCKAGSPKPTKENNYVCECKSLDYEESTPGNILIGCHKRLCTDPNFCHNDGTCIPEGRKEVCQCKDGYFGPNCEIKCEEYCDPDKKLQCVANETAPQDSNAVRCVCVKGHKLNKEEDVDKIREIGCVEDLCVNNKCANGSHCDDSEGEAKCICPENVFGELCAVQCSDVCDPNLNLICLNDTSTPNGYKCACAEKHIESSKTDPIDTSGCRINFCETEGGCKNEGRCVEGRCECDPGFFGTRCEIPCDKLCPKAANLTCVPDPNHSFNETLVTCKCKDGDFIFHDRKNPKKGCFENLCPKLSECVSNGVCSAKPGQAVCTCNSGFYGKQCEKSCLKDKCNDQPNTACSHPTPPDNEVDCLCIKGYIPNSEKAEKDGCKKDLCGEKPNWCNFGKCKDDKGMLECECNVGYFKPYCLKNCTDICNGFPNTECKVDNVCKCKDEFKTIGSSAEVDGCRKDYCKPDVCVNGGACTDVDEFAQCLCPKNYFGKTCSDECAKLCSGSNLKCEHNKAKPLEDNAAICLCKDGYIPINEAKIEDGCKLDTCLNNQCNIKGTESCLIASGTDHRCKCKPNYYGKNCEKICGQVCNKPNLMCKLKDENDITNDYKCECKSNYKEIDSNAESEGCAKKCETNTECPNNSTCTDKKICKCNATFGLNGDTCFLLSAPCKCQNGGECVQDGSNYKCKCLEGFAGTECQVRCDSVCGPNAKCEGLTNDIKCNCESSYVNVSTTASTNCLFDICTKETPCKNNGKCALLRSGDYSCVCASEAFLGKDCSIKCEVSCGKNANCIHDSVTKITDCNCLQGFENVGKHPETKCVQNLCKKDTCRNNGQCKMEAESKTVCKCASGFSGEKCECVRDVCNGKCQGLSVKCISDCNSYACECTNSSQIWNEQNTKCEGVDLCDFISCNRFQECHAGKCRCKPGHKGSGDKCEEKFDICNQRKNLCTQDHMECVNVEPDGLCICKKGYYFDEASRHCDSVKCEDMCPFGQSCNDKHECECPEGFTNGKDGKCEQTKQCQDTNKCGANSICFVHEGVDHCICNSGYVINSNNVCVDIDECKIEIGKSCEPLGRCVNLIGSYYKCNCGRNDFDEDKKICLPVNECVSERKKHNCDPHTTKCQDTRTSFTCNCISNHERFNDTHCRPEDKCRNNPCRESKCENNPYLPAGYECKCPIDEVYDRSRGCTKVKQVYPGRIRLNGTYDQDLANSSSQLYLKLKTEIETALSESLKTSGGNIGVKVVDFMSGSILVDYILLANVPLTTESVANMWKRQCKDLTNANTCALGVSKHIIIMKDYLTTNESNVVESRCINEANEICNAGGYVCSPNPTADKSFACHCKKGFEEKYFAGDIAVCEDIDECKTEKPCKESEVCHNLPGTYHCGCKSGYSLIGGTCKESCSDKPCEKGTCVKLPPNGWRCDCDIGYIGQKCETEHSKFKASFLGWEIAVGILAAVFVFGLIISCMVIRKQKKKLKNSQFYDESQMNEYSQSTNNLAPTKNGRRINEYDNPAQP